MIEASLGFIDRAPVHDARDIVIRRPVTLDKITPESKENGGRE